jgi:hypothetical protein
MKRTLRLVPAALLILAVRSQAAPQPEPDNDPRLAQGYQNALNILASSREKAVAAKEGAAQAGAAERSAALHLVNESGETMARADSAALPAAAESGDVQMDKVAKIDDPKVFAAYPIKIRIDEGKGVLGQQTMTIEGVPEVSPTKVFHVATGRPGFRTPLGDYNFDSMEFKHWSRPYSAWMPYTMFFNGGRALHEGKVGVQSHGCVHLDHDTAQLIYNLMLKYKRASFAVELTNG